jgi:hypothetical protein
MGQIKMYDGRVYGVEVSKYGIENGYLDYQTLSKIVGDCVLNNSVVPYIGFYEWEVVNGSEENEEECYEVYQYYIISESGADFLREYTDELVYYHSEIDMYVWGITHFGTGWDYVLTDLELV